MNSEGDSNMVYIAMCYERYEGSQLLGIAKTVEGARNIIRNKLKSDLSLQRYFWINKETEIEGLYFDYSETWMAERFISIEGMKLND